jgi:hypothetical protein
MNLAYAQQDYFFNVESTFLSQKSANAQAASQRLSKPSVGGLVLGLAGAGLSGLSTGLDLKEKAGGWNKNIFKG